MKSEPDEFSIDDLVKAPKQTSRGSRAQYRRATSCARDEGVTVPSSTTRAVRNGVAARRRIAAPRPRSQPVRPKARTTIRNRARRSALGQRRRELVEKTRLVPLPSCAERRPRRHGDAASGNRPDHASRRPKGRSSASSRSARRRSERRQRPCHSEARGICCCLEKQIFASPHDDKSSRQ